MNQVERLKKKIIALLSDFEVKASADLRSQVLALVPVWQNMNKLGTSLLPRDVRRAALKRLLYYFKKYPGVVLSQHELAIVAGISEWARRVRELRVELGWSIFTGKTILEMIETGDLDVSSQPEIADMSPSDYIMTTTDQDREAAYRWKVAKDIREKKVSVKDKVLEFLRENVGSAVSGEELRYVAKDKTEWARRVRELRTEEGWPISTYWNGRPELKSGMYLLEEDRQLPVHDRKIPDGVRRKVLVRDKYACKDCDWTRKQWNRDDPRHLELHHLKQHVHGGANKPKNLLTLCNVCHDTRHAE